MQIPHVSLQPFEHFLLSPLMIVSKSLGLHNSTPPPPDLHVPIPWCDWFCSGLVHAPEIILATKGYICCHLCVSNEKHVPYVFLLWSLRVPYRRKTRHINYSANYRCIWQAKANGLPAKIPSWDNLICLQMNDSQTEAAFGYLMLWQRTWMLIGRKVQPAFAKLESPKNKYKKIKHIYATNDDVWVPTMR